MRSAIRWCVSVAQLELCTFASAGIIIDGLQRLYASLGTRNNNDFFIESISLSGKIFPYQKKINSYVPVLWTNFPLCFRRRRRRQYCPLFYFLHKNFYILFLLSASPISFCHCLSSSRLFIHGIARFSSIIWIELNQSSSTSI